MRLHACAHVAPGWGWGWEAALEREEVSRALGAKLACAHSGGGRWFASLNGWAGAGAQAGAGTRMQLVRAAARAQGGNPPQSWPARARVWAPRVSQLLHMHACIREPPWMVCAAARCPPLRLRARAHARLHQASRHMHGKGAGEGEGGGGVWRPRTRLLAPGQRSPPANQYDSGATLRGAHAQARLCTGVGVCIATRPDAPTVGHVVAGGQASRVALLACVHEQIRELRGASCVARPRTQQLARAAA